MDEKTAKTLKLGNRLLWKDKKSKVGRSIFGVVQKTDTDGLEIKWKDGFVGWVSYDDMQSVETLTFERHSIS